jgi:hypothetical protein
MNPEPRRRPTQTAVQRVIAAALKAGIEVARVEVDADGTVVIVAGKPADQAIEPPTNPWDRV